MLVCAIPLVLAGTLLGVNLYRKIPDINFRIVTFFLLGVSGTGLVVKAIHSIH